MNEVEDGMGFAGLVPTLEEERVEKHIDQMLADCSRMIDELPSKAVVNELVAACRAAKREMWDSARAYWTVDDFKNWAVVQQIDAAIARAEGRKP